MQAGGAAASMAVTTCASLAAGGALDVAHGLQRSDAFRLAAAARMLLRSGAAAEPILVNACGGTLAPDAPGRPPAQDSAQCKLLEQCIRQSGSQVTAWSCLIWMLAEQGDAAAGAGPAMGVAPIIASPQDCCAGWPPQLFRYCSSTEQASQQVGMQIALQDVLQRSQCSAGQGPALPRPPEAERQLTMHARRWRQPLCCSRPPEPVPGTA